MLLQKLGKVLLWVAGILIIIISVPVIIFWQPDQSLAELKPKWINEQSEFIDLGGMQVHIRDEGNPESDHTLVLIHGTGASLHTWEAWVEELASSYRVISLDLPGYGLTGPHPEHDYRGEKYADIIAQLIKQRNASNVVLAGNSLGGYIAWVTATLHPERINGLVLIDSSGMPSKAKSVPVGFKLARLPGFNFLLENVLPRRVIRSSLENVYGDPDKVTDQLVDRYFDMATREGNRNAIRQPRKRSQIEDLRTKLSNLSVPCLIQWGEKDQLIPVEAAYKFKELMPHCELVTYPELGHVPHEEDPAETLTALKTFIESLKTN
ncbi:MAG: alpha/beta hydrolase [Gammaproteobacteria bacterium]|nr:alpha/beta hydrolase [Gammaproteobacteria bacterium]